MTDLMTSKSRDEPPYLAPFPEKGDNDPRVIPRAYAISLFPDHTIDDLSAAVGRDVQPFVQTVLEFHDGEVGIALGVRNVDDDLLAAIRTYRGVRLVERSSKPELDAMEEG